MFHFIHDTPYARCNMITLVLVLFILVLCHSAPFPPSLYSSLVFSVFRLMEVSLSRCMQLVYASTIGISMFIVTFTNYCKLLILLLSRSFSFYFACPPAFVRSNSQQFVWVSVRELLLTSFYSAGIVFIFLLLHFPLPLPLSTTFLLRASIFYESAIARIDVIVVVVCVLFSIKISLRFRFDLVCKRHR